MTRVGTQVELDDALLARIDDLARRLGSSRQKLIEDSIRREVATRMLDGVFERNPVVSDLTPEEAERVAYQELAAMRSERDEENRPT